MALMLYIMPDFTGANTFLRERCMLILGDKVIEIKFLSCDMCRVMMQEVNSEVCT